MTKMQTLRAVVLTAVCLGAAAAVLAVGILGFAVGGALA